MNAWFMRLAALLLATAGVAATAPAMAAPCAASCLTPGDHDFSIQQGLYTRTFRVHVPANYTGARPVALTLDIHGHLMTSADQQTRSGQQQQSERLGFIVVWPQGIANSWNGNGCCTVAYDLNIDDVGFLRAVIAQVEQQANIDTNKVYATGWSNGGGMAERMGCEAADVIRAIASVAHPLNRNDCTPARPISVLEWHGTADTIIPYAGGNSGGVVLPREVLGVPLGWQGAVQSLAAWKVIEGCSDTLSATQLNGGSRDQTYTSCRDGTTVGLVSVANGQHDLYTRDDTGTNTSATPAASWVDVAPYIWSHVFKP